MNIQILELLEGAKKASGLTVIIDVFRAYTLEAYCFNQGVEKIYPIGSMDEAFALKQEHPDYLLFAERHGKMVEGCDGGNAPSAIYGKDYTGKTIIHSTSAGTQGLVNAIHADTIIAGSLVTAKAIAKYIQKQNPDTVSLVAMGNEGKYTAAEDLICAYYIKALLEGKEYPVKEKANQLRYTDGKKFFNPETQKIFPKEDFPLCIDVNRFDFVLIKDFDKENRIITRKIKVD